MNNVVNQSEQQGNQSEIEEEKKSHESSSSSSSSLNPTTEIELTSNMAFDRFSSLGAYGYSNGMIKLFRVFEPATEL